MNSLPLPQAGRAGYSWQMHPRLHQSLESIETSSLNQYGLDTLAENLSSPYRQSDVSVLPSSQ